MDAAVTLKLSPQEFDLLRAAISEAADKALDIGKNAEVEPAHRRAATAHGAQLKALLERLR